MDFYITINYMYVQYIILLLLKKWKIKISGCLIRCYLRDPRKKMYSFFHFLIRSGYDFNFIQHERWKKKLIGAQAPLEYHKPAKSLAQMLLEGF